MEILSVIFMHLFRPIDRPFVLIPSMEWYTRYGMAWHGMAWHGIVWYDMVLMVWCNMVRRAVVSIWCDTVWCASC